MLSKFVQFQSLQSKPLAFVNVEHMKRQLQFQKKLAKTDNKRNAADCSSVELSVYKISTTLNLNTEIYFYNYVE